MMAANLVGLRPLFFGVLLVPACLVLAAPTPDFAAFRGAFFESLFSMDRPIVVVERLSRTPLLYRGCAFENFDYSLFQVRDIMTNFSRYPKMFHYVHRFEPVALHRTRTGLGTWYGEARAGFARLWGVGTVDSVFTDSRTYYTLYVSQNTDSVSTARYRQDMDGWFTVEVEDLKMVGMIRADSLGGCRVGIAGSANPLVKIPPWLFQLALKVVMPRVLADIKVALEREYGPPQHRVER